MKITTPKPPSFNRKITAPKPPSFNRIARLRLPPSRRSYRRARRAAVFGGRMTCRAAKLGVRAGESRAQLGRKRQAARPMAARASGVITGATIMYFLDPHAGRRRRHVARDRMRWSNVVAERGIKPE